MSAAELGQLKPGLRGEVGLVVSGEHTAPRVGSGAVSVLATPVMINLMEAAALASHDTGFAITVNAGLAGSMRCGCTVPPGAVRMAIGYYPLFENSTVRAETDAGGRAAMFKNLGPQVEAVRGTVGLLFREDDLRTTH